MAQRGEIWYAALDPTQGAEQAGIGPVLVMQNNAVSRFTTTLLVIPLTTNLRRAGLPSCVRIAQGEGGLTADSVALCHQMRAVDVTRLKNRLGTLTPQTMNAVENCILFSLDIF